MAGTDANVGISLWDEERSWTIYNFQNPNRSWTTSHGPPVAKQWSGLR